MTQKHKKEFRVEYEIANPIKSILWGFVIGLASSVWLFVIPSSIMFNTEPYTDKILIAIIIYGVIGSIIGLYTSLKNRTWVEK